MADSSRSACPGTGHSGSRSRTNQPLDLRHFQFLILHTTATKLQSAGRCLSDRFSCRKSARTPMRAAPGGAARDRRAPDRSPGCGGRRPTMPGTPGRVRRAFRTRSSERRCRCRPRGQCSGVDCVPCRASRPGVGSPAASARPAPGRQARRWSRASGKTRGRRRSRRRRTDTGSTYTPKRHPPLGKRLRDSAPERHFRQARAATG